MFSVSRLLPALLAICALGAAASARADFVPVDEARIAQAIERSAGARHMQQLDDAGLADVQGQAGSLFLADKITPNELEGQLGVGSSTDFTFYRMGMDVKLDMNLNMSKLQLGCGGVNDFLTGPGGPACDIDLDYVGFMGVNANGDRPATTGPASSFTLTRPYIQIAVKNDGTANREIVGLAIGAQKINGALRIGRDYTGTGVPPTLGGSGSMGNEPNLVNQENGGTCNPSATTGSGVVNCHSGINSLSGFLAGVELSAGFYARARVCLDLTTICPWGVGEVDMDIDGCLGRINFNPCNANSTPFFVDAGGTRLSQLHVAAAKLNLSTNVVFPIELEGYGALILNMRQIHYLIANNSSDFYLSFQRQPVSWPRYEKVRPNVPQGDPGSPGTVPGPVAQEPYYDSCNSAWGQVPTNGRCSSAYSEPANTGWWLNAANMKVLNLQPGNRIVIPGTFDIYTLLGALGPDSSNLVIDNPKLDFVAARNCYGAAAFC